MIFIKKKKQLIIFMVGTAAKKPALITRYYCHYRSCYCRRRLRPLITRQSLIKRSIKRSSYEEQKMLNIKKNLIKKKKNLKKERESSGVEEKKIR
ncbi:hypothetical protein PUN28_001409 [Cardiocondyla obscurior]|uniref:Uncharacterized protein n=1 Tax=Cardiocondyla obscurior TaxID=286306 RepID=A0AAW2H541_9HYME